MLEVKLFEVRDRATFIPVLAVNCAGSDEQLERWLLRTAGYACDGYPIVLLCDLQGGPMRYDSYAWGDRTYAVAHEYITQHWSELATGDVVDVEYVLGETATPKRSENA